MYTDFQDFCLKRLAKSYISFFARKPFPPDFDFRSEYHQSCWDLTLGLEIVEVTVERGMRRMGVLVIMCLLLPIGSLSSLSCSMHLPADLWDYVTCPLASYWFRSMGNRGSWAVKGKIVQSFYFPFLVLLLPGYWMGLCSSITIAPIGWPSSWTGLTGFWSHISLFLPFGLSDDNDFLLLARNASSFLICSLILPRPL